MSTPPRWSHQNNAFDFVLALWARKLYGAMLAMAMGTGKSRVACELATEIKAERVLIVCPLRVIDVWGQQLARFAPQYRFVPLKDGGVQSRTEAARRYIAWSEARKQPVALAINYDAARISPFANWAATRMWDLVIADESHRLKDPRGRASIFMAKLGLMARRRLALTGTPMPHEPIDIWSQFRFMNPFHLDRTYGEFKSRYAVMGGFMNRQVKDWRDLDDLERRFRELAFRVSDDVLDLPPELDEVRSTTMDERGAEAYRQMEREYIALVEEGVIVAANAMVRLLRLQQMTSGWVPGEDRTLIHIDNEKERLLEELLEDLKEPVVVFCRFRSDLDAVHRAAAHALHGSWELSGERDELAQWQRGEEGANVLAAQIQAGGVGVDLTRARVAIYYSIGFKLDDYVQSRARIRRPPQQRPCLYIHLQIRHSIDEYVLRAVEARSDLVDSVLQELKTKGAKHVVAR